jgi:hypothetical protein
VIKACSERQGVKARLACALLACGLWAAGGCGEKVVTVSGKVTYQGQVLPRGTVRFMTADNRVLASEIAPDGVYSIAGVPPGTVKVSVSVPPAETLRPQQRGPEGVATDDKYASGSVAPVIAIPSNYHTPETSGLTCTVAENSEQTNNIDLR